MNRTTVDAPLVPDCQLHHVYLVSTDLERTVGFYRALLGMTVSRELEFAGEYADRVQGVPGARGRAVWGRLPGSGLRLEFVQWTVPAYPPPSAPARRPGLQLLSFQVPDVSQVAAALRAGELPVDVGPVAMPDGTGLLFTHDPDGTPIEFVSPP